MNITTREERAKAAFALISNVFSVTPSARRALGTRFLWYGVRLITPVHALFRCWPGSHRTSTSKLKDKTRQHQVAVVIPLTHITLISKRRETKYMLISNTVDILVSKKVKQAKLALSSTN
jgi:hypothetical protein